MAQRFSNLDEAAHQLGISKDRLTQLREAGKVRGYRDGASWKFRSDDIDKLAADGIPAIDPPPSDLDLGSDLSLDLHGENKAAEKSPASSDLDLGSADDELLLPAASDLNLDEIDEPTVPALAGEDDDAEVLSLDPDDELLDLSDSILLNEAKLGGAANRPPSTIIGKAELDPDGDLDLTLHSSSAANAKSDVKLAATSDVLSGADDDSLDLEPPSLSDNFQGLAEVDIDLEAESSRILSPKDTAKVKGAAARAQQAAPLSDLELASSDSDVGRSSSDIDLGGDVASGLTGLSALELEDSDDQVLGEGSDITLSSSSSGINIISPSDSGLALDEVALSSASMSSPLDLGGASGSDVALQALELSDDEINEGEPFQLTPLGEADDEEKDSSQIIALDDISEEDSAGGMFQPAGGDGGDLGEDFAAVGLTPGVAPVAGSADDMAFSGFTFSMLSISVLLLLICGMMSFDLMRNIFSWDHEVTPLNSSLLEVVYPWLNR